MKDWAVTVTNKVTNETFEVHPSSLNFRKDIETNYIVKVEISGFTSSKSFNNAMQVQTQESCIHKWNIYVGLKESFFMCTRCGVKK